MILCFASCIQCKKALNLILWLLTDEQAWKLYSVASSAPAIEVLFLAGTTSYLTSEFKEWTQCSALHTWNMRKVVWFDHRHCLLLPAWAVTLQGTSWISGRPLNLKPKRGDSVFFFFLSLCLRKKKKASCRFCFLPLLRVLSLPTN